MPEGTPHRKLLCCEPEPWPAPAVRATPPQVLSEIAAEHGVEFDEEAAAADMLTGAAPRPAAAASAEAPGALGPAAEAVGGWALHIARLAPLFGRWCCTMPSWYAATVVVLADGPYPSCSSLPAAPYPAPYGAPPPWAQPGIVQPPPVAAAAPGMPPAAAAPPPATAPPGAEAAGTMAGWAPLQPTSAQVCMCTVSVSPPLRPG